jgi:hypothetical protein
MENNFTFCTLACGRKYIDHSDYLINDIISKGASIFVLTDNTDHYEKYQNKNIKIIKYEKNYFSYNEKRTVVRECLKYFDTAVFLDADVRVMNLEDFDFLNNVQNGLHIFNLVGNIKSTFSDYPNRGQDIINYADQNNLKYKRSYNSQKDPLQAIKIKDQKVDLGATISTNEGSVFIFSGEEHIEHFLETKWILKKDNGKEIDFLNIWDGLAEFSNETELDLEYVNGKGASGKDKGSEGAYMSIAACSSSIRISCDLSEKFNKHFISNYERKLSGELPWINIV